MMNFILKSVSAAFFKRVDSFSVFTLFLKNRCRIFFLLTALFLAPAAVLRAGEFDLHLNDVSGLDEPWPLIGGLPFPEGELHDASQVRIIDGQGEEVAAQIDVATSWRDGSVRWALAGFNASPRGGYRVEFGAGVSRSAPESPLVVEEGANGVLRIDTGAAVYEFLPDRLLPESGRMGQVQFLSGSGDGAYLLDNHGRLSRVAGEEAGVSYETVRAGPVRAVIRREGWYVTEGGERVARARAWFYFTAGSPYLRVTHSLIFTGDTNDLWVRDYGLDFRSPGAPREVVFALGGEPTEEERMPPRGTRGMDRRQISDFALLYSKPLPEARRLFRADPAGGEVYMLQDVYPHFLKRDFRAVIGRADRDGVEAGPGNFWTDIWEKEMEVAGDWADGEYGDYGLTLVMPRLAEMFPKEIAFSPDGARAAFWSGRSSRELDFSALTLVNEYWQNWAEFHPPRGPEGARDLALTPSNAQGAARTHDLWLLPRTGGEATDTARRRAETASRPPLLQADPAWLCGTGAVGWPLHHRDEENFPEEEAAIVRSWEDKFANDHAGLRRTGFIEWGGNPTVRGYGSFYRISLAIDYALRRHAWWLYARSGRRDYYDYGTRFNRFLGDWHLAHWTAGKRRKGLLAASDANKPFHWGTRSKDIIEGHSGHDIIQWMLEYYLTGDEYALELVEMYREGLKELWADLPLPTISRYGLMELRVLGDLYAHEPDPELREMADALFAHFSDLENPLGISDEIRYGALYKVDNKLFAFSNYYLATGEESARQAILKVLDHEYRFDRVGRRGPMGMFFVNGYRWTGNEDYLRIANYIVERARAGLGLPLRDLPVPLGAIAEHDGPLDPWPLTTMFRDHDVNRLLLRKPDGEGALELHSVVIMEEEFAEPRARLESWEGGGPGTEVGGLSLETELVFQPESGSRADPHRWHVRLDIPGSAGPGIYQLDFPGAERVDVINSDAVQTSAYAPGGFRTRGDGVADYFMVEGIEDLKINLSGPMELRCPDGTVALEADRDNTGELSVPVEGREGAWSVLSNRPEIVILRNVETLMSRSPDWLVTGAGAEPPTRFEMPSEEVAFVPGFERFDGQALHLPNRETVGFPRGRETDTGYEFFPGPEGTVEFWFRPNWSSAELPTAPGYTDLYFLRAGSQDIHYRRGFLRTEEFAHVNLWAHGRDSDTGFTGEFSFNAGKWYHVAAVWRIEEGQPGNEGYFNVYINGREFEPDGIRPGTAVARAWPGRVGGYDVFHRRPADETISIGPLNGTIAQLRISDTVRYESDFEPPVRLGAPDADTLVIFPLDGNMSGRVPGDGEVQIQTK